MSSLAIQSELAVSNPASMVAGLLFRARDRPLFFAERFEEKKGLNSETKIDFQDREEINCVLQGDRNAFASLMARHQQFVANRMWKFTNNLSDHEELVHDVFVEAFTSLSQFRFEGSFAAWLRTIATRQGYRYWKQQDRNRQTKSFSQPMIDSLAVTKNDSLSQHEIEETLRTLLEQLPPRDRLVLTLLYWEQHSMEEAAEFAGWSLTMTKVQAYRARRKLKRLLKTDSMNKK